LAALPRNEAADPDAKLKGRSRPKTTGSNEITSFATSKSGMNSSLPTICRPAVVRAVEPANGSVLKLIVFASAPDSGTSAIAAVTATHFMRDLSALNICCSCEICSTGVSAGTGAIGSLHLNNKFEASTERVGGGSKGLNCDVF
jgi:hypothetical protein